MGNLIVKNKKKEEYVNFSDIPVMDGCVNSFNTYLDKKRKLVEYVDTIDMKFDYDFIKNKEDIKDDDKFKLKYLKHVLAICLSFLNQELKRIECYTNSSEFIDNYISPLTDKLIYTIKNYNVFRVKHKNALTIQRWYRKLKNS